jgi:L-alanine-DL-glutamate epimerase-like enolase superfamily enzyme
LWLEEPVFPPEDYGAIREVGEACGIPIAGGENWCFATQFAPALELRAVQYAQPSVTKVGGVTEFLKVMALAEAHNVRLAPHSPYFGPGALATLHLLAAYGEPSWFEYFYLWPEAKPYAGLLDARGGSLDVPTGPGLGADPDPGVIERYRVV